MSRGRRMFVLCLFALLATYSGLYAIRFFQINARVSLAKYVKASELPKVCLSTLELYDDSPENVGVWVTYMDFDGDGIDELITDAGDHGRGGGANSWYEIWKKRPSGEYVNIGCVFCDWCLFVPGWLIYGNPGILCIESTGAHELVLWRNGRYSGKGHM